MDAPSGFRQPVTAPGGKKRGVNRGPKVQHSPQPQLFEDTSIQPPPPQQGYMYPPTSQGYSHGPYGSPQMPGQQFLSDPMANMAMQYGSSLAGQGKEYVNKNLEKYVSTSKLKYYFAVDTSYVGKKLMLLLFPFSHSDWSIKYNQDEPVAPRFEVNAPDLYIPVMAFVTYILVAGVVLGTQERFTPEQLGIQASSALVWNIIELLAMMFSIYVMNVSTDIKYLDILSYIGYKYFGMIGSLLAGLLFHSTGYYAVLLWFSLTIVVFLIRMLRVKILSHSDADGFTRGSKRSLYLILSIALVQPILMWWLTRHIIFTKN
ncbi:hypothetical protein CHS0354_040986 [Potamilus streckersoni]|uniref:Protein YIF1 n=1 Tax=Potamilus streckersoni TaxID=2493646 RepID=A0AAE0SVU0_9BIVA|nr:hypothetical protein CHS0354_040986 [Potamilus streckersoni]